MTEAAAKPGDISAPVIVLGHLDRDALGIGPIEKLVQHREMAGTSTHPDGVQRNRCHRKFQIDVHGRDAMDRA